MAGDINLKAFDDQPKDDGFTVHHIADEEVKSVIAASEAGEKVKISFGKFAQLVARSDIDELIEGNRGQDVVIDTNLLAELATPGDDVEERKIPVIFSIGLVVGIILTYILFKYL